METHHCFSDSLQTPESIDENPKHLRESDRLLLLLLARLLSLGRAARLLDVLGQFGCL